MSPTYKLCIDHNNPVNYDEEFETMAQLNSHMVGLRADGLRASFVDYCVFLNGEETACGTAALDGTAPDCGSPSGEHEWTDETVHGHSGGVKITETCKHCGLVRTINTWDTCPYNGEQGFSTVSYQLAEETV